jgi:predicted nuclease of predicted toxin-antitoxin system
MQAARDIVILERAFTENRIIVSADSDFSMLLGVMDREKPSFILFREAEIVHPKDYVDRLVAALPALASELEAGAVVVFRRGRIRIRRLPFEEKIP